MALNFLAIKREVGICVEYIPSANLKTKKRYFEKTRELYRYDYH